MLGQPPQRALHGGCANSISLAQLTRSGKGVAGLVHPSFDLLLQDLAKLVVQIQWRGGVNPVRGGLSPNLPDLCHLFLRIAHL